MTDFSKIGKSNRSRGAAYERKISKMLTNGLGAKFKRSPRSGALLREGKINGAYIGGDLTCEKNFKFSVECKNCKNANIEALIKHPTTAPLMKYWCQCIYDADKSSTIKRPKLPLLFFHMKSIRTDYACVSKDGLKLFKNWDIQIPMHICVSPIHKPVIIDIDNKQIETTDIPSMYIMLISDFIKNLNKQHVFYQE